MEQLFTMGQVAKELGVTKNTLARWEEKGVVDKPRRDRNDHRIYTAAEVEEIKRRTAVGETALYLAKKKSDDGQTVAE